MARLVLGLCGAIGAGKDTAADYLKQKHNFLVIGMGDMIREEAKKLNILETRENLQDLGNKKRKEFGADYWIRKICEKIISAKAELAAINGIRVTTEAIVPREIFKDKFKIALLESPVEVRFQRLKERKRPGDPLTFEDFQKQEQSEWEKFGFAETFKLADVKLNTNSSIETCQAEVGKLLKQLTG